ncbi:MAG: hypothetical protein ACRBBV_01850 [Paracoccaceae bacterium]
MLSRFIYLTSTARPPLSPQKMVAHLGNALNVPAPNRLEYGDRSSFDFYTRGENGLHWAMLNGEFCLSCDLNLQGIELPALLARLRDLSNNGFRIALPDNTAPLPDTYILFDQGAAFSTQAELDENAQELHLIGTPQPIPSKAPA